MNSSVSAEVADSRTDISDCGDNTSSFFLPGHTPIIASDNMNNSIHLPEGEVMSGHEESLSGTQLCQLAQRQLEQQINMQLQQQIQQQIDQLLQEQLQAQYMQQNQQFDVLQNTLQGQQLLPLQQLEQQQNFLNTQLYNQEPHDCNLSNQMNNQMNNQLAWQTPMFLPGQDVALGNSDVQVDHSDAQSLQQMQLFAMQVK